MAAAMEPANVAAYPTHLAPSDSWAAVWRSTRLLSRRARVGRALEVLDDVLGEAAG